MTVADLRSAKKPDRVYYIDWLRILAVLLLIPFHTARIFDIWEPFYAKNAETSAALSYGIIGFMNSWHMPLLFLLAGSSTWFALGFRNGGQYAGERLKRLVIPLVFGVLVIVPPQAYLARMQNQNYADSYWQFLPDYFQVRGDLSGYTGLFTLGHLWFVLLLFFFALIALPLFLYLKGDSGRQFISRLASFCDRPGMILLLFFPILISLALPDLGGKIPFYYITFFIYGFILMADARFRDILERNRRPALVLAIATSIGALLLSVTGYNPPRFSIGDITFATLRTFCTWSWLLALVGLGQRYLNVNHRWLPYASQAAYPFYILHQTVIVTIGYYVVQWNIPLLPKFLIIASGALVVTLLAYDLLVQRTNVTRFLFGMKPRTCAPRLAKPSAADYAA